MSPWLQLACAGILMVGISACSVKRTTFNEGEPGDAAVIVDGAPIDDAPIEDAPVEDAAVADGAPVEADGPEPLIDAPPPALGTQENPAGSCGELQGAGMSSAVYWVRHASREVHRSRSIASRVSERAAGPWCSTASGARTARPRRSGGSATPIA